MKTFPTLISLLFMGILMHKHLPNENKNEQENISWQQTFEYTERHEMKQVFIIDNLL